MCADRIRCRGQALVELLVAMIAIVPLYFGVAWLGKVLDARQATIAAARALAFECTVRIVPCSAADSHPELAGEVRRRFFGAHDVGLRSDDGAGAGGGTNDGNRFWVERDGRPMLERYEDVSVAVARVRFDSPFAFAGGQGERVFPGAVRMLSELAGPGRFGLDLEAGLVDARVEVRLSRSRAADGWVTRLASMPLTLRAHLTILTDAWNASGPYGAAPDSVETRVEAGSRVPGLELALDAGWLPVRGLLATADALGFESRAGALRWHDIDVDLVPPDRLPEAAAASRLPDLPLPDPSAAP
jgi:hypothetical protein